MSINKPFPWCDETSARIDSLEHLEEELEAARERINDLEVQLENRSWINNNLNKQVIAATLAGNKKTNK